MLDIILLRLKLWSFIVLPATGFLLGQILQILLGSKHNPKFESIIVHIITVAMMTILFADISINSEFIKDIKDRTLFLAISYLFILGTILGLISHLW